MKDKQYIVIEDVEYYGGDCQHPKGWNVSVATIDGEDGETICIGSIDECKQWLDTIDDGRIYLNHGEAGKSYRIAKVVDDSTDYQTWIDTRNDWDGCPSEDGSDYDANCEWAETQAYKSKGMLYIANPQKCYGLIVDLAEVQ